MAHAVAASPLLAACSLQVGERESALATSAALELDGAAGLVKGVASMVAEGEDSTNVVEESTAGLGKDDEALISAAGLDSGGWRSVNLVGHVVRL